VEYFSKACYEMIESGRQFAVNKLRTVFFPGRYRSAIFYDIPNSAQPIRLPIDYLTIMPCEMTVYEDGRLDIDWDGCSSAGYHSNNSSFPCILGNHIYTLLQDCLADGFFNQGLAYSFDLKVPRGTVLNPEIDKACSAWLTAVAAMTGGLSPVVTRAYFAKGFREEGFASKPTNGGMFAGGVDRNGNRFAVFNFEVNCSGTGGQSCQDGIGASMSVWNPEVNMSDCETFEHIWPLMWLGRGLWKDGGGYGKHRGGAAVESLYVIENEPQYIESGCIGSGDNVFVSPGLFGGYPGPARYRHTYINTNYKELVGERLPLPHREGDHPGSPDFTKMMKGELLRTPAQSASRVFGHYDLIHQSSGGGGGWGDALDRPIEAIEKDLEDQLTSEWTAGAVYHVALDPKTKKIDPKKTKKLREAERKARLKKGIPVKEFMKAQREKILKGDISEICKTAYNDCFQNSSRFLNEFRECWGLSEDFKGF
jgi:acetone carboxylase alpha subunit